MPIKKTLIFLYTLVHQSPFVNVVLFDECTFFVLVINVDVLTRLSKKSPNEIFCSRQSKNVLSVYRLFRTREKVQKKGRIGAKKAGHDPGMVL
jgi:hypothetical protein